MEHTGAVILFLVSVSLTSIIHCQTNGVRSNLINCYNASYLPEVLSPLGRPPATLNIFIELIRRVEDANPTMTPRELSAALLQRLRQDGIMGTRRVTDSRFGIPFSPKRLEAHKSTLLLQKFLTNITLELNYGDLDDAEICSLHYMISSTVDNRVRDDETTTCSRSSRYTSRMLRRKRDLENPTENPVVPDAVNNDGRTDIENIEVEGVEGFGVRSISTGNTDISQCPIEQGVVFTNYGTIKAGQVLAGIATGFNAETVLNCDNRYSSTIAGEIAEAALVQANDHIEIGAQGGWNSSINPRYYFLQKNMILQTTDAEIRGSLDGLYMALKLDSWRSTFSDIKISQMLDMYYSPNQKGIFDNSFRSCNRNILYTAMTTTEKLRTEVFNFMGPLDEASQYGQTVTPAAYETIATAALNSFNSYLPKMNTTDLACKPDDSLSTNTRVATDLLIFIDANWNYNTIQNILSYTLDNIDVNKFGSRYTVFNGQDGINITTNNVSHLLNFYKQYNITVHQNLNPGFDYTKVCEAVENLGRVKLNNNSYTGGESTIVLLIPRTTPSDSQKSYLSQRKEIIRQYIPDLTILVLGTGSQNEYDSIVATPSDVIILSETTNEEQLKQTGQSLVERIKNVPRSIINPSCGSEFSGFPSTFSLTQYVELRGVNYYRISPHYFYSGEGSRNLKITENSYGSVNVCVSRDQSRPNNQTSECETLKSAVKNVDISGYCGSSMTDCSPIYISITGNTSQTRCKDVFCRYPDDIKYTISLENVGCASNAVRYLSNIFGVVLLFLFLGF